MDGLWPFSGIFVAIGFREAGGLYKSRGQPFSGSTIHPSVPAPAPFASDVGCSKLQQHLESNKNVFELFDGSAEVTGGPNDGNPQVPYILRHYSFQILGHNHHV